jgi:hypothetical protein
MALVVPRPIITNKQTNKKSEEETSLWVVSKGSSHHEYHTKGSNEYYCIIISTDVPRYVLIGKKGSVWVLLYYKSFI